jgi:hypothetical protein
MKKVKVAFDIDFACVHAWRKKDRRKEDIKKFFDLLRKNKDKFECLVSSHVLDQISVWRDKKLANDIISLFKSLCKVVDLEENIRYFEKARNVKIKDFTQNYASEVGIKTEDALAVIVYSLIEVEYFVTFNKKHLRNKYAKLKEIGWKYGIKIPEIMLPSEFTSLFSQLFEQSSGSLSSHHYSKFNRVFNFFSFPFHILLFSLFVFKSLFFSLFQLLKQISAGSPSKLSSDNYRINRAKGFLNFFFNLHSSNLESQFRYSFVKLPFISSASFIGSFFTFATNAKFNSKKHKSFSFFNTFDFHNRFKFFLSILAFSLLLPLSLAQTQSHPLSQITPIDVNLNMFGFNITNVTFVGINLTNPQYTLDVAGDVRWSGSLRGGIVPWNLLSGYNLNVQWSGLLGWGNLTGYNLNVNWIGKLGWGNLTNYPSIITQVGSGLNVSTQSLANNITLGVNFTEVQKRVTGSCSGSNAIQVINSDGTVGCVDINLYGNVTGSGTSGYIPLWRTSSSLNNSLINQTNGNIWITSGNLNILLGGLQIGGTNVITSSRSIINVYDVNASRFFQNGVQVIDTLNAGPGISITGSGSSRTIINTGVLSLTAGSGISLNASTGNILISNTGILGINVNAPLTLTGGQTPTLGFNYNTTAFAIINDALTLADAYFTGAAYDDRFVNEGQSNSITTSMIADGAITNPKIALNAVNYSQIQQVSCSAGQALRVIGGGTYECVDVNINGTITGSGSVGYIPLWNGTYSLNNSVISQSGGNVVINSGNLNIQSGGLLIGGTTVIDSNRNLVGINQVNQNLNFGSSYSIVNANWVNATNLNASNTLYATTIRGSVIYQGSNQVIDTINANAPISVSGSGNSRTIGLNYDNNFTLVGSSLSLSNTGVVAGTYGSSNQVAQFTVNAQGRITSASNVNIAIDASQIVSGILPLARGGTGADLSGAGNYIIVKNGSSLTASPVDLTSGNFTGVLPASKGGTGIYGAGGVANRVLLTTDGSIWQAGLVNLASMVTGVLSVSYGGTGASDANTARANLNAAIAGTCPGGYAVQNATTGSLQCIPVATPSSANVTGAGIPGQIAFWVGSSTLSGDSNLIWDNSGKRLGISVSSPQAKLHVSGDVIIDV